MNAATALTGAQKTQLLEHGYLVVEDLIDDATIEAVRDELHEVVDGVARKMVAEGKLRESFSETGFDRQLACIGEVDEALAKEVIARVHGSSGEGGHMGPAMFDLIVHPRLLDAIESIVGPEIIGSSE
jgi:phytanoyl-CoA hydroxylase